MSFRLQFPPEVSSLIQELKRLPGIGPQSATRIALWLLQEGRSLALPGLLNALEATKTIELCSQCGFFSSDSTSLCPACSPQMREEQLLCIVEHPHEVLSIEKTGVYQGCYHCLGGRLAPLDDIGPEDLRLEPLQKKLEQGNLSEVILATSSNVEGEATASYLTEWIRQIAPQIKLSRPAQGLPAGGGLDNTDQLTLMRALSNRKQQE